MKLQKNKIIFLLFLYLFLYACKGQEKLYIFPNRYEKNINELRNRTTYSLQPIKILGQYMIDPNGKGNIKYDLVDKYLDKLYPNKSEKGILCINLEGSLFRELADNAKETKEFKAAESNYIELIRHVKQKVPFVKVGIYGLPFKGYYESQLKKNENQKLDSLLNEVDILMPSLYIAYPAKQTGIQSNIDYLEKNLNIAFEYGTRLKKPVYPFFWYLVHPANKKFGLALIPKDEMNIYMNYIYSYKYKGKNVSGVVWWDSPTPFNNGTIKSIFIPEDHHGMLGNLDDVFEYYLKIN